MSRPYDGRGADPASGSVRRARERAQGGYSQHQHTYSDPMEDDPPGELRAPPRRPMGGNTMGQPRVPRSKHAIDRSANPGVTISRPQPVPQWPLSGPPMAAMNQPDAEPYRPPPGRPTQAPQRPPRPSQVPSLLDQSRLQEPTPVFLTPETDDYRSSVPPSPSSRMTVSSLGSVPDFPEPNQTSAANRRSVNLGPPRASANLGPPPSSRRGVSSFYSRASFVSPIPEESLNSRSHGSYASSAAMPDSWPGGSGPGSPSFYDDGATERSQDYVEDDFHDESKLVRSASIGKRGKPSLITTKSFQMEPDHRPAPSPVQPFDSGMGYVDASTSSSNTLPMAKTPTPGQNARDSLSPDAILGAFAAASATNLTDSHVPAPSPSPQPWNRLSAIRRPPKLDIDAVRKAEERGSMTSLPDLIRRATRLATMIDHGKRPGSRFDNLNDFFDEKGQMRGGDKENSGLSDMLAAFPPPAQPTGRQSRGSWFRTTSWPLAPGPGRGDGPSRNGVGRNTPPDEGSGKRRRRCCGLPVWAFVILLILLLGIIVAAVLVPLEFFVFKNLGNHDKPQSALSQCQESLKCQNGGTNIMSQGTCSCICTNGFTGSDCSAEGSDGCTMTDLGGSLSNVTLGKNIPRLIEDSQKNFSIPLSGTAIMAKLNSQELSCIAQNSLVTFDGAAARKRNALLEQDEHEAPAASLVPRMPESASAIVVSSETADPTKLIVDEGDPDKVPTTTGTTADATKTSATAVPSQTKSPTNKFQITNEVLDFARVAVLFVLQQENVDSAQDAQSSIDKFFAKARKDDGVQVKQAESVSIGDKSSVDLLRYKITIGSETIGGNAKRHLPSFKTTPTYVSVRHRAVHALRQHR